MDQLVKSILELGNFSKEQTDLFSGKIKTRTLERNAFLLKEGQVCQAIHFLDRGSLRQYFINDRGVEMTLNLMVEGDWVLDYQSFTSQKPSKNNMQAFENCLIFELSITALHELIEYSPKFFMLGKLLQNGIQPVYINGHFSSPEEKYLEILSSRPQLLEKFPLNYIASFLGMAPETLSRVRRRIKTQAE